MSIKAINKIFSKDLDTYKFQVSNLNSLKNFQTTSIISLNTVMQFGSFIIFIDIFKDKHLNEIH